MLYTYIVCIYMYIYAPYLGHEQHRLLFRRHKLHFPQARYNLIHRYQCLILLPLVVAPENGLVLGGRELLKLFFFFCVYIYMDVGGSIQKSVDPSTHRKHTLTYLQPKI